MSDIREATILGRVGQDPELRHTGNQHVVNLRVATKDYRGDTEWNTVVIFGEDAENAAKYLRKGSKVLVRFARPEVKTWVDKGGQTQARLEFIAGEVTFL